MTTKVISDGYVYARSLSANGNEVVEKADPRLEHDAPVSVVIGSVVTVTFIMRDFDGVSRSDSDGTLLLDIGGTECPLPITEGRSELELELHDSVTIEQRPPYFQDARFSRFTIEVTF